MPLDPAPLCPSALSWPSLLAWYWLLRRRRRSCRPSLPACVPRPTRQRYNSTRCVVDDLSVLWQSCTTSGWLRRLPPSCSSLSTASPFLVRRVGIRATDAVSGSAVVSLGPNVTTGLLRSLTVCGVCGVAWRQVGAPANLACSVCEDAVKEGLSLGCGAVGKWISDLCLDAEPLCLAALKLACGICNNHCDYNVVAQVGSHDVAFAVCALCGGAVFGPWHSNRVSYLWSGTPVHLSQCTVRVCVLSSACGVCTCANRTCARRSMCAKLT